MMLCFRWQGGAVSLPPRQAHFLHRPLQYINPQRRTSPEALTKFAKRKNSSPAALPLSPTHYWGFRGDTSLARKAQGTAAQEKVRPKIVCKGMSLEFLPCIAKHMRFEDCFVGTVMCAQLKVCLFAFFSRSVQGAGYSVCSFPKPNMKPQLFAVDLILLCISCRASALATSIPTVSKSLPAANFTNLGAAYSYGTDTTAISKTRRKRYISQNDMLAILDYHNKVRGKVFPPASNMEYMVSESFRYITNQCTISTGAIFAYNDFLLSYEPSVFAQPLWIK